MSETEVQTRIRAILEAGGEAATPPKLPRFGATNMGIGLRAYHLCQAGLVAQADALIQHFEIATGMAGKEDDHAA